MPQLLDTESSEAEEMSTLSGDRLEEGEMMTAVQNPFYIAFLARKKGKVKTCKRCGEEKLIEENFTLKLKRFYISPAGERRLRRTPSVECSPNCLPCETARTLEGRRAKIASDPIYRAKYLQKFTAFINLHKNDPTMQDRSMRRWAAKSPEKIEAHRAAARVHPERQVCSIEGCVKLGERHHPNYAKPTEIVWLCRQHHKARHWEDKYGSL